MLFQIAPTADWLQFGALGLLALVLAGVGSGAFFLLKAYTGHINEQARALSRLADSLAELARGLAIINEQSEYMARDIEQMQQKIQTHEQLSSERTAALSSGHERILDRVQLLQGNLTK